MAREVLATIREVNDRYSCNMCHKQFSPDYVRLYELDIGETSIGAINICLCRDCFVSLPKLMNNYINEYIKENEGGE